MSRTFSIAVIVLAAILIIILGFVFFLVLRDLIGTQSAAPTLAPTAQAQLPTATSMSTLPPPAVEVPATFTPLPTAEATATSEVPTLSPTDTPAPTLTLPPPTPTSSPVPLPTNTRVPPPPPTNTPVPTVPPPDTRGLVTTHFGLQDRSSYTVNGAIWFEFSIANNAGGSVPFGALGVMPKKDGGDRLDWYQHSWGGNNDAISVAGLSWEDNIKLPEPGNYTLRLVICFEDFGVCRAGGGTWVPMSHEIPVTIN